MSKKCLIVNKVLQSVGKIIQFLHACGLPDLGLFTAEVTNYVPCSMTAVPFHHCMDAVCLPSFLT
jgi:hypothetical protein